MKKKIYGFTFADTVILIFIVGIMGLFMLLGLKNILNISTRQKKTVSGDFYMTSTIETMRANAYLGIDFKTDLPENTDFIREISEHNIKENMYKIIIKITDISRNFYEREEVIILWKIE